MTSFTFSKSFARYYLLPKSSIYIVLPLIEDHLACAEVVKSVSYGGKEFYRRLFSASNVTENSLETGFDPAEQIDIVYQYAWWQDWFEVLFDKPWDLEVHFISKKDGFLLRKARLGQARLGKAIIGNTYKVEEMRI